MKFDTNDELAKKIYKELNTEFIENTLVGDDVPSSMLKAMSVVLANIYRELRKD